MEVQPIDGNVGEGVTNPGTDGSTEFVTPQKNGQEDADGGLHPKEGKTTGKDSNGYASGDVLGRILEANQSPVVVAANPPTPFDELNQLVEES